jgi:hypothetical protein
VAAATAGDERRRARRRDPNLGFPATDWDADGIYVMRASKRSSLGRRSRWRRGGAGARRGGAGHELRHGPPVAAVHEDNDT